jgi:hypothetical protein
MVGSGFFVCGTEYTAFSESEGHAGSLVLVLISASFVGGRLGLPIGLRLG